MGVLLPILASFFSAPTTDGLLPINRGGTKVEKQSPLSHSRRFRVKTTKRTTRTETTRNESTLTEVVVEEGCGGAASRERRSMERAHAHDLPHRAAESPKTSWHHLQVFFIEYPPRAGGEAVPQVKVFANGRQQVRIRVVLSPRDANGVFVAVPASELKGMVDLIDYNTGYLLPTGWTAYWEANEYIYADWAISNAPGKSSDDYVPHDNRPGGNEALAADQIAVDYYVTASNVGSLRIAASVTPPEATQPVQTRPGASGNQFDSSVNVDGRPPLNLPPPNFNHRWGDHSDNDYFTIHNVFITLSYNGNRIKLLHVADDRDKINGSVNIHADAGDFRKPALANGGGDLKSWEGVFTTLVYKEGGAFKMAFYDVPDYLDELYVYNKIGGVENPEDGAICYLQHLFDANWHFFWGGTEDAREVNQQRVKFIDEFGNAHRVLVGNGSNSIGGDFSVVANW